MKKVFFKKIFVWFSLIFILCAFGNLICFQLKTYQNVKDMSDEVFDKNVHYALRKITREIAREDVKLSIDNLLEQYSIPKTSFENVRHEHKNRPRLLIADSLEDEFLEKFKRENVSQEKRYAKELVEDVANYCLKKGRERRDILRRIDFAAFEKYLKSTFEQYDIRRAYLYNITNKSGEVLRGANFLSKEKNQVYSQALTDEQASEELFLNVVFTEPNNYDWVFDRLILPAIIIVGVLFLIFAVVIIYYSQQKRLDQLKYDFINNLTHELKTPISSISLAGQLMQDDAIEKTPERLRRIAKTLGEETKRLNFLVEKVLQLSVFDKDKALLHFSNVDVNEILGGIVQNYSLKIENFKGKILTDFQAQESVATIDEMQFTNVIYNLFDNALKYSKDPLILRVKTWNEGENLCIAVEDNGIGIKKADLKYIFDRFYRVSTGNLHNVKGFGLGLSYVKKVIKLHKGTIAVDSEYGVGTWFTITLPFCEEKN